MPGVKQCFRHQFLIVDHFASFNQKEALKSFGKTYLEIPLDGIWTFGCSQLQIESLPLQNLFG